MRFPCLRLLTLLAPLLLPNRGAAAPTAVSYGLPASWLTAAPPPALGEPLNMIISGRSDPFILTEFGLLQWVRAFVTAAAHMQMQSFGYSRSSFGIDGGNDQVADLGDGVGARTGGVVRFNYNAGMVGSCLESLIGGSHARYWQQSGPSAPTRAWFLAASAELDLSVGHQIADDGYNLGRDWIAGNATARGPTTFNGTTFSASVMQLSGLTSYTAEQMCADDLPSIATLTAQKPWHRDRQPDPRGDHLRV